MSWAGRPERGGAIITRLALWLALRGGRVVAESLVAVGTAWFLLTSGTARTASRDYLRRVLGRPAGVRDIAKHFHNFGRAVLDRVLLLGGCETGFEIRTEGLEALQAVIGQRQGCILLGAHLGSFEVLRRVAQAAPVPVWALMYRRNGGALTTLLDRLAPGMKDRVLEIGDVASMIRARECVERGEIIGILADRVPDVGEQRTVRVPFLGAAAAFPTGPWVLASTLGAPVVLFHAVRTSTRRYDVRFTPFMDRVVLTRGNRLADLCGVVARYAAALEAACLVHPYQWFNFYPFWSADADPDPAPRAASTAPMVVARGRGGIHA